MMQWLEEIRTSFETFTPTERRDVVLYILGIMIFKFGTEAYGGSLVALATNRYDALASSTGDSAATFQRLGLLQGLNLGMRCFGSILVGPLITRFPTRTVLGAACALLGLSTTTLLILDATTGGTFKQNGLEKMGTFNPDMLIPIHVACGIGNGMTDLVRAIIPSDLVGGHVEKLQRVDCIVHIFFNLSAITGSLSTGLYLIPLLGHNRAFIVTPICCGACTILLCCISRMGFERLKHKKLGGLSLQKSILMEIVQGFWLFARSICIGARVLATNRDLVWLIPAYGVGSYAHRYLDTALLPKLAKRYLGHSS